jgi:putative transposase
VLRGPVESAQFTSWAFRQKLRDAGIAPSMGAVGSAFDNAMMESFWGRMQVELFNRRRWKTRIELASAIHDYIEVWHNTRRRHSALGMHTPTEIEQAWAARGSARNTPNLQPGPSTLNNNQTDRVQQTDSTKTRADQRPYPKRRRSFTCYKRETLTSDERDAIRQALREYVQSKTEVARRNSERHARRLRELTGQQQKLLQAFYNGGVDEDVLKAEQERIKVKRAQARKWAAAAVSEVKDIMEALDNALLLLDKEQVIYETLPPHRAGSSTKPCSWR